MSDIIPTMIKLLKFILHVCINTDLKAVPVKKIIFHSYLQ